MTTHPAQALAEALCDGLLGLPLHQVISPVRLVVVVRQAGLLYLGSPQAEQLAGELWQRVQGRLAGAGTLRTVLPPSLLELVTLLLATPYLLPKPLLVALLSRPPMRRMSRELMLATLLDYSRKVRTQVGEVSQSRGGMLGRLATEAVKKSTSAIGSLAPGMTAAVSEELERQFRSRSSEFADSAVDDLAQRLATMLTDPSRQAEHRELGRALLDFVLDLPLLTIRDELTRLDPVAVSAEVRRAVLKWLGREESTAELLHLIEPLAVSLGNRSLRDLLGPALAPIRGVVVEVLLPHLASAKDPAITTT